MRANRILKLNEYQNNLILRQNLGLAASSDLDKVQANFTCSHSHTTLECPFKTSFFNKKIIYIRTLYNLNVSTLSNIKEH